LAAGEPILTRPPYPKRLIEVDLPIARISAHARREKSIRHGHISTLHIWWARRPLAACRAVICAALWPDPADPLCPPAFREAAVASITAFACRVFPPRLTAEGHQLQATLSLESRGRWEAISGGTLTLDADEPVDMPILRMALLDFIADFANWDNSTVPAYLETSRSLTQTAHEALGGVPGTRPLVADPFAGGGSIPLEALRVGADAFASDLNPVPVLLNKFVLEYIPKYGKRLAEEVRKWGAWIKQEAENELAEFYPKDSDGATPIAYLWARTILCEGPACGAEVPLIRSLWLAKKTDRAVAMKLVANPKEKRVDFQIIVKERDRWVDQDDSKSHISNPEFDGTVKRGSATCPCCGYTTPNSRVRAQLAEKHGGTSSGRLLAIVTSRPAEVGRFYRTATKADVQAADSASKELQRREKHQDSNLSLVPNEEIPPERPSPNARGLSAVTRMGVRTFGDLFTPRQALTLSTFARWIDEVRRNVANEHEDDFALALQIILAFGLDRLVDRSSSLCRWDPTPTASGIINTFSRQALPIMWDFAEGTPFENKSGGWLPALEWTVLVVEHEAGGCNRGQVAQASATAHVLPDDSANAFVTDPPYYDAIPYADLSAFFYVWMRRALPELCSSLMQTPTTPKDEEAIWNPGRIHVPTGKPKDTAFYESQMAKALSEGRRITALNGIGVVVFAHKSTAGWEAMLSALIDAGWITTASWPVDTEMGNRMNAMGTASLASSVHLVCRPREEANGAVIESVGEWRDVLGELPKRIHEWMPRLAAEGVVGADAIFACLGPALEIFSRYRRVEKANGEIATLREYLEHVWAAVSTEALSLIFKDANAAGLEADARLTAMWLWTIGGGGENGDAKKASAKDGNETVDEEGTGDRDDEESTGSVSKGKAAAGFLLEYDAARKMAQGLGVHLEQCESFVEIKGDKARLLPVAERTPYLFGKGTQSGTSGAGRKKKAQQKTLFAELDDAEAAEAGWSALKGPPPGTTVLDRVHQAMILFAANRAELLKRFLVEDGVGKDARFWKLADNLNKLYPPGTDERRWIEGVLARKKGLGQ
jgi:putative DNA methylase